MIASNSIFVSNFAFLVSDVTIFLNFFSCFAPAPQYTFPLSMYNNSAYVGICLGTSALQCLFNRCCVNYIDLFISTFGGCIFPIVIVDTLI